MLVCIIADNILRSTVLDDDLDVDVVGYAREEALDLRLDALAMLVVVVVARGAQHGGIDLGNAGHAGGNLGTSGSVSFQFERKGQILVPKEIEGEGKKEGMKPNGAAANEEAKG